MDNEQNREDQSPHVLFDTKFSDWIDNRISSRIDPKVADAVNRLKLWIFGGLVAMIAANMAPVLWFSIEFGEFRGIVENRLGEEGWSQRDHEVYAAEIERRLNRMDARIDRNSETPTTIR